MKDTMKFKKNMRFMMAVFIVMLAALIIYMFYSIVTYGEQWFATPYNPRVQKAMQSIDAGAILDRNGKKLAWTSDGKRKYISDSSIRKAVSHVVGDSEGKTVGAETVFAKYIYGFDQDIVDKVKDAVKGGSKSGSDVTLTIDAGLSEYVYKQMGKTQGSCVLWNYQTGEILASVSIPTFDPANLEDTSTGTRLVDRATMGRYPPGSVMKIVTATAAIESGIDLDYTCTGSDVIEGQKISCAGGEKHGRENLEEAFTHSCNTYFARLSEKVGAAKLMEVAERFGFNKTFSISDFTLYKSNFELSANLGDLAWAGIGQYNDLITPMHAAMIAGAVANDGRMVEPKLLKSVESNSIFPFSYTSSSLGTIMSPETAKTLQGYMRNVVKSGTGTSAGIKGATMYGKTGTAEYTEDSEVKNNSWFVGFIDDEEHPYAVAVIGEGAGYGSRYAAPLAKKAMQYAIKNVK